MVVDTSAISIRDNLELSCYELRVDGQIAAAATYRRESNQVMFLYTELMAGFEGLGLGQRLAAGALDDVRRQGLTVRPRCPFIGTFVEDHPEYLSLLAC